MSEPNQENENPPFYKEWAFWFVVIYLLFIVIYSGLFIHSDGENFMLSSNELGDFLAGTFAPLAFLFLYLGYKRQGEELKQNTKALEQQASELANSVAEQKRLIQLHQDEQVAKHFSAKPFLEIKTTNLKKHMEPYFVTDENDEIIEEIMREHCFFDLTIINEGEIAKQISFLNTDRSYYWQLYEIEKSSQKEKRISLSDDEVESLNKTKKYSKDLILEYHDLYGKKYSSNYKLGIEYYEPENEYYPTCKKVS